MAPFAPRQGDTSWPYRAHVVSKLWMFLMDCLEQMKTCFTSTSVSLLFLCLALLQASPHAAQKRVQVSNPQCWLGNWLLELRQAMGREIQARHPDQRQAVLAMEAALWSIWLPVAGMLAETGSAQGFVTAIVALHALHGGLLRISFRWSTTATPSPWATFGSWPTTWRSFLRWQAHREDREGLLVFMPRRSRREWFESGKPLSRSCIPVLRPGK